MSLFKKIIQILQKPFPQEESNVAYLKTITIISVFVTLFLYIFQPFGINTIKSGKFLICLGFGITGFLAMAIYLFGISRLLNLKGSQEHFTFGTWILDLIGIMLTISLANFFFARGVLFGNIKWELLPQMIYATFTIGLFPIIAIGAITMIRKEKKYQTIADEINQKKKNATTDIGQRNDLSVFDIPVSRIRYIEALQNYVKIGYINSEGKLMEQTERATLKSILDEIEGSPVVKCHRSFLVNREAIVSTSGNAQGLLLTLSDCDKTIPVSRSYVAVFREA